MAPWRARVAFEGRIVTNRRCNCRRMGAPSCEARGAWSADCGDGWAHCRHRAGPRAYARDAQRYGFPGLSQGGTESLEVTRRTDRSGRDRRRFLRDRGVRALSVRRAGLEVDSVAKHCKNFHPDAVTLAGTAGTWIVWALERSNRAPATTRSISSRRPSSQLRDPSSGLKTVRTVVWERVK